MFVNFHFRKRRDIILLSVLGREPERTQATTMATATKTSLKTSIRAASNFFCASSISLSSSKDCIEVQEKKKKIVALCFRRPRKVRAP